MNDQNTKMKLWHKGLILFACAIGFNSMLKTFGITGGLILEVSRLFTLTAMIVLIIGLIRRNKG